MNGDSSGQQWRLDVTRVADKTFIIISNARLALKLHRLVSGCQSLNFTVEDPNTISIFSQRR